MMEENIIGRWLILTNMNDDWRPMSKKHETAWLKAEAKQLHWEAE